MWVRFCTLGRLGMSHIIEGSAAFFKGSGLLTEVTAVFRRIPDFLRRQYLVIMIPTIVTTMIALTYVAVVPPSYVARAVVYIDPAAKELFRTGERSNPEFTGSPDFRGIDSLIEVIRSESVLVPVIETYRLEERPEYNGGWLAALIRFFQPEASISATARMARTLEAVQNSLEVKRIRQTNVIEIAFQSREPSLAAEVTNAVAARILKDQGEERYARTSRWFQDRLKELQDEAVAAENNVVVFKEKNRIVDSGGRELNEQQIGELNSAISSVKNQVAESRAKLRRIEKVIASAPRNGDKGGIPYGEATVSDALNGVVLNQLRSQYLNLVAREAELSAKYGQNHLAAVKLRGQIEEVRKSMFEELLRLAEAYRSDLEIAQRKEVDLEKNDLGGAVKRWQEKATTQIQLRKLESYAKSYKSVYDTFVQRYLESIQQQSFPGSESRIVSLAFPPIHKSSPRTTLSLLVGFFSGLLVGLGLAVLLEEETQNAALRSRASQSLSAKTLSPVSHL